MCIFLVTEICKKKRMQIRKKQASAVSGGMESSHVIRCYFVEFRYGVFEVPEVFFNLSR
jgi:hypothetical protein